MSETETWPDLAIGLYDKLTGRDAVITYEADDLVVEVPNKVGADATHTPWKVNGTLRITTTDNGAS